MELILSDGIVELLETATVRSSLTAMCPIEKSFVCGPRLYSPEGGYDCFARDEHDTFYIRRVQLTKESLASSSPRILRRIYLSGIKPSFPPTLPRHQSEDTWGENLVKDLQSIKIGYQQFDTKSVFS